MKSLTTLILDEADQLLEMGFRPDITKIISFLPTNRQSLLFSATVPKMVRAVSHIALKDDYKFVDCVGDAEMDSVKQVAQYKLFTDVGALLPTICALLHKARTECPKDYKVFFTYFDDNANDIKSRIS